MTAFETAWLVVKGRMKPFAYHFTDRKNVPGIMREGLNPAFMASGRGVSDKSAPIMDDTMHDWSDEEMDEIARNAGYQDKKDLYEGDWTWAMASGGDVFDDMAMYAGMIDDPVMIGIKPDNEGRWVNAWEWAHDNKRTRDTIDPKHLEVIDFAGSRNRQMVDKNQYPMADDGYIMDEYDRADYMRQLLSTMYERGLWA